MTADDTLSIALDRMLRPVAGGLSAEHARYVLGLTFAPEEHARIADLSRRGHDGTLSADEQEELDTLLVLNAMLGALQSKARASLRTQQQPAA